MGKKTWLKWKTILHNDAIYWVLSNYCQANALKSFATWIGLSSLNREKGTSYLIKLYDLPNYYGITKCKTKLELNVDLRQLLVSCLILFLDLGTSYMHLPYLLLCISLCSCPASDMSNSKTKLLWNLVVSRMGNPIFHSVYTTSPQHRKNWLKENKLRFNLHLTTCLHKYVQVQSQIHCISYVKTNFCQGRPQEQA